MGSLSFDFSLLHVVLSGFQPLFHSVLAYEAQHRDLILPPIDTKSNTIRP